MARPIVEGYLSQATLAVKLGVSTSTVSRALRGDDRIRPEIRERVRREAELAGYRPNPMVTALMRHVRTGHRDHARWNLVWLDFETAPDRWKADPVCRIFYESARRRAESLGYPLTRVWVADPRLKKRDLSDVLLSRGVRGILLQGFPAGAMGDAERIPVRLGEFVVVGVGTAFRAPELHFASNDQHLSMQRAVRELWQLGYRRIGYVGQELIEHVVSRRFSAGYLATVQEEFGGTALRPLLTTDKDVFVAWLTHSRPDAIVTTEDWVPRVLKRHGYRVPEDIGLAHLHVEHDDLQLSGICQQSEEVAAAAVDIAVNAIVANEIGIPRHPKGVLIGGVWMPGKTVRHAGKGAGRR